MDKIVTDTSPTPESLATERRSRLREIGAQEFQQWRHGAITSAFLQHLNDLADNLRAAYVKMWESGSLGLASAGNPDANSGFIRGQVRTYDYLARITLDDIHAFYQAADEAEGLAAQED